MQERTLLRISLATAIIGLAVLAWIPERGPDDVVGVVAWSNDTTMRVLIQQPVWVDIHLQQPVAAGTCVSLHGYRASQNLEQARLVAVHTDTRTDCVKESTR